MLPGLPPLVHLETVTLGSDTSAVTLPASGTIAGHANFPAGSKHVVCIWQTRSTTATTSDQGTNVTVNGDTGAKYDLQRLDGAGSSPAAFSEQGTTSWSNLAAHTGDNQDAGFFSPTSLLIPHAFGTDNFTGAISVNGIGEQRTRFGMGQWEDTAAITSVTITPSSDNWKAGSTFSLYVVDEEYLVSSGEQIITGSAAAFSDVSVPSQVGDISIISYLRSSSTGVNEALMIDLNADANNANYSRQYLYGAASSAAAGNDTTDRQIGGTMATGADANHFSPALTTVNAFNYGANDPHVLALGGNRSVSVADGIAIMGSVRRNNVEAVTSVNLTANTSPNTWEIGSGMWVYAVPKILLQRQEIGAGGATSVTFTLGDLTIPTTVKHLRLNYYARSDRSYTATNLDIELNSSAADFDRQDVTGSASSPSAAQAADNLIGEIPADSATANEFGGGTILFADYSSTSKHKHLLNLSGHTGSNVLTSRSMRWAQTAAIATIVLKDTHDTGAKFLQGSVFELEGIGDILGWSGTVMGIDDPGKVMGVEKANIGKVMGVESS